MKNLNKLTALIVASIMILSTMTAFGAESTITQTGVLTNVYDNFTLIGNIQPDIETVTDSTLPQHKEALEMLNAFGVVVGTLGSDSGVTRGELTAVVMRSMGLGDSKADKQYFYDVPMSHTYASYINSAYESGIVTGSGGYFNPDSAITYLEAMSVLIRAMGLGSKAQAHGGYPGGFMRCANDADLFFGIEETDYTKLALPGDVCVMLVNALISDDYMAFKTLDNDGTTYTSKEDLTMLEDCLGISIGEGSVNAVGVSNLLEYAPIGSNLVKIDSKLYKGSYADYIDLLGYVSEFFYDDKSNELIYARRAPGINETLVLSDEVIVDFDGSRYVYEIPDTGKIKYADVASNVSVMYNGKLASSNIENLYIPDSGTVTLINTYGSGDYDVILVKSYEDIIVGTVDLETQTVYDKYDNSKNVCFDPKNEDAVIAFYNSDGKETYASMLKEYDIVSVAKSVDSSCVSAVGVTKSVSGTVESITTHNGTLILTINGTEYEVTKRCNELFDTYLNPGTDVTIRLNLSSKVAAVTMGTTDTADWAYVIKHANLKNSGFNTPLAMRLLTSDGKISTYEVKEKCDIDGETKKGTDKQKEALDVKLNTYKLIKYELDAEGKIKYIDTASLNSNTETAENSVSILSDEGTKLKYKGNGNVGDKFFITNSTKLFVYFPNASDEEDMYKVLPKSALSNDNDYAFVAYKDGEKIDADAVCVELAGDSAGSVSSSVWYVVTDVRNSLSDDGEDAVVLHVAYGSKSTQISISKSDWDKEGYSFEVGDIVRFDLIDGELMNGAIKKVYSNETGDIAERGTQYAYNQFSTNNEYGMRIGYVYDKLGDYFILAPVLTEEVRPDTTDGSLLNALKSFERSELADFDRENGLAVNTSAIGMSITKVQKTRNGVKVTSATSKDLKSYLGSGNACSKVLVRYNYMLHLQIIIFSDAEV